MRYWYIDSERMVTMMLIDKPYYDYDYKYYKSQAEDKDSELNTDEKTHSILARFGIGTKREAKDPSERDMEELQRSAMSLEE